MTPRQELQRKARRFFLGFAIFFAAWSGVLLLVAPHRPAPVVAGLLSLYLLPLLPLARTFRCPACQGGIGTLVAYFGPLSFLARPVNFCPRCGVALDNDVRTG